MASASDRRHIARVVELGCIICEMPAVPHHLTGLEHRGKGQKSSNLKCIPLCPRHHTDGGPGIAFHAGEKTWEAKFGTQEELMELVRLKIG